MQEETSDGGGAFFNASLPVGGVESTSDQA